MRGVMGLGRVDTAMLVRRLSAISFSLLGRLLLGAFTLTCAAGAEAAPGATPRGSAEAPSVALQDSRAAKVGDVMHWVERMHGAPCRRPYTGTFVVLSASGVMATSKIWHACDEHNRLERVESLSGASRTVFRRNDEVRTFSQDTRTVRTDRRDTGSTFPRISIVSGASIPQYYAASRLGQDRVAGYLADVVWFKPADALRFGYRLWSEVETGLVVKVQTISPEGKVLENAAFSELDLRAPIQPEQISRLMDRTEGFQEVAGRVTKTSAQAEGWVLRQPVAGFVPVSCHQRTMGAADASGQVLQCLYSDGLASVSLFVERFDPQRHPAVPHSTSMGATHLLGQRLDPDAWVTAVGEVPLQTLRLFAGQFQRIR
ncbi:MucB/RseB C-terminal domain-containing protein [Acidovorax sp. RAC01]|uniref:MucB/RseB C-terminal domain-containing protein n=1 Tax=Acidovorax sp. RAC01 TaxID=1842533 RepID=UPI0008570F17|nr:MucB/RseB C-terminal domain-containing protein [Acidovorax sp. RAC01]AOG22456.1 mucB/RseB family protein [Acidovorax sp. RAC01]